MPDGRVLSSGGPPMTSWPALPLRSEILARPYLSAVSLVTAKPSQSSAGLGSRATRPLPSSSGVRAVLTSSAVVWVASRVEERQHRPVVLGQQIDLALLQGREDDLPGPQVQPGVDVDAGLLEHGGVHLGQDELLGEVGRADGHARLFVGLGAPLERVVSAAAGGQEQRQAGRDRGTKPDPSHG